MLTTSVLFAVAITLGTPPRDTGEFARKLAINAHLGRIEQNAAASLARDIARIRWLGIRRVRLEFDWASIERAPGYFDWSVIDRIVDELMRNGVSAYGLLDYSPRWAHPQGASEHHRPIVHGNRREGNSAFAHFAAAAARRYSGRIRAWEIWNEPNNPTFWENLQNGHNHGPNAADYATLFVAARDSITAVASSDTVIVGGLASFSGRQQRLRDPLRADAQLAVILPPEYLRRLLRAGVRPTDVGLHPYSGLPPGAHRPLERKAVFPTLVLDDIRSVLDSAGLTSSRLWITEWGVDAGSRSPALLGQWFSVALHRMVCDPRIPVVTLYVLRDPASVPYHYSLIDDSGQLTRSGAALDRVLRNLQSCGET